ncbi:hypothetical protein ACQKE9_14690 [Shewanella vesiculosa]|uniref:hypothetical protein n=1 Tax=Shewanella vesiculosa TaxID=518738 RepID=UPI003D0934B2
MNVVLIPLCKVTFVNTSNLKIAMQNKNNRKATTKALKRIEIQFDAELNSPQGDELEKLVSFVEVYEDEHYPM